MVPFSMFSIGDILLVSLQEEIDDSSVIDLSKALSRRVRGGNIRGVVIDLGNVEVVDTFLAEHIRGLASVLELLNARTVISGLGASAIVALKNFDISFGENLTFALDSQQALEKLGFLIGGP